MSETLELQTQLLIAEQNHQTITDMLHAEIEGLKKIINAKTCEKCIRKDQKYMNLANKYQALANEFEANKKKLKELLDGQTLTKIEPPANTPAASRFSFPLKVEADLENLEKIGNNNRFKKLVVEAFNDRFRDRDKKNVHKIVMDQFITRELVCKCVWEKWKAHHLMLSKYKNSISLYAEIVTQLDGDEDMAHKYFRYVVKVKNSRVGKEPDVQELTVMY